MRTRYGWLVENHYIVDLLWWDGVKRINEELFKTIFLF